MLQKLKSMLLDDTIYMAFLLILVGVASFGLGRLSVNLPQNQPATVTQSLTNLTKSPELLAASSTAPLGPAQTVIAPAGVESGVQNFIASKSGTKFHALNCPGAKQIKESNKIYFATELEAEAAGYTRAANCKF
jgi:hypothetical protein